MGHPGGFLGPPPFVLGWDVSGVVEATGYGVTLVKPGDEAFGMLPYPYAAKAHQAGDTGHVAGKLVLTIQ